MSTSIMSRANRPQPEPDSAETSPKTALDHGGGESNVASPSEEEALTAKEDDEEEEDQGEGSAKANEEEEDRGARRGGDRSGKEPDEPDMEDEEDDQETDENAAGEIVEMNVGKRPYHGKVWKKAGNGEVMKYHCLTHAKDYSPGEAVYIESQRPDQPYYICQIQVIRANPS